VLIIFGAGKIPQLGEGLGKAIKGFKTSLAEADALDVTPNAEPEESQIPPQQVASQPQATQPQPQEAPVQQPVEPTQSKQG
jgi:sec-independent protein translocase protein TatA